MWAHSSVRLLYDIISKIDHLLKGVLYSGEEYMLDFVFAFKSTILNAYCPLAAAVWQFQRGHRELGGGHTEDMSQHGRPEAGSEQRPLLESQCHPPCSTNVSHFCILSFYFLCYSTVCPPLSCITWQWAGPRIC